MLVWGGTQTTGEQPPSVPASPVIGSRDITGQSDFHPVTTLRPSTTVSGTRDPLLLEHEVIVLTNQARTEAGLPPLKLHEALRTAARQHAQDMAEHDFFSHTGSDGSSLADRINRVNYPNWLYAAENIAAGFAQPEDVVQAWLNSPAHRANILHPNLKEIGVGYAYDPNDQANVRLWDGSIGGPYYHYWVQDFGTRVGAFPVIINLDAYSTRSHQVELYIYGEGWAREMKVSNYPDFRDARWQPYRSTLSWTLLPGTGTRTVYVRLKDAIGITVESSDSIEVLPVPDPSTYGLTINDGAQYTNSRRLNLRIDAPSDTADMRVSLKSDLSDASWQPYTQEIQITVPEGTEGRVTVYAQIKTADGWESPIFSDTIIVDLSPPIGEVIIREREPGRLRLLTIAHDRISGVSEMQVGTDPQLRDATWQPYASTVTLSLGGDVGANQPLEVYARFRDRAGNLSDIYPARELSLPNKTFIPAVAS
ncbi:MAG TPA: CAP domain-containing protein [Caldilineae bacterium]|nr:CAP domain-containing protein [Caldilineae bacterium]